VVRGSARRRRLSTAGFYALAALFMLPTVFVFYWMITLSLKPQIEARHLEPPVLRDDSASRAHRVVAEATHRRIGRRLDLQASATA